MDESRRDPIHDLSHVMKETLVTGNKADDLQNADWEQDGVFHCKLFVGNIGYRV